MGDLDRKLAAALKSGDFNDLKALEEPFARQAGLNPEHLAARKAATRAKYGRPLNHNDDDLRKAHRPDQEPTLDLADIEKSIEIIESLAKIRRQSRTNRKRT